MTKVLIVGVPGDTTLDHVANLRTILTEALPDVHAIIIPATCMIAFDVNEPTEAQP